MAYEIIYVCSSKNNKNVREGELNILEKHEEQLCFYFGSDKMNIKKRFYDDIETLNKDFDALVKLKNKENIEEKEEKNKTIELVKEMNKNIKKAYEEIEEIEKNEEITKKEPKKEPKKAQKEEETDKYKIIKRKK